MKIALSPDIFNKTVIDKDKENLRRRDAYHGMKEFSQSDASNVTDKF